MEIGSHDRLQEGALSLELANGLNCYPTDDDTSMETEKQRAESVPRRQCWVPGQGKVIDTQQQGACWSNSSGTTASEPAHHADVEDAQNLVAFSASAGSLPPSSSSSCVVVHHSTAQLYERFAQETGVEGTHARLEVGAPEESSQAPKDLNTLKAALSQAKHGNKPPNCNCDGPDCPDYLEWLEKKIKLATSKEQGSHSHKLPNAYPHVQPQLQEPHSQHQLQSFQESNGNHLLSIPCSQPQQITQGPPRDQGRCSKPPIPCSPQVLSIAKEKNVSLQTAIAIDALTQLSATSPHPGSTLGQTTYRNKFNNHQHPQNVFQTYNGSSLIASTPGTHSSSSRSQSVPPGLHNNQHQAPCEHHRPQSQGHPPHASPVSSSTSPYSSQGKPLGCSQNLQKWQQSSNRGSEQINQWRKIKSEPQSHIATALQSSSDPMSELKQLLGDTSNKYINPSFKLPVAQQLSSNQNGGVQTQENLALTRIKQESDLGENYLHNASTGPYSFANGQQIYSGTPLSPNQAAISHSTQAALQQHLHYKRNLFSNHSPGFGAPGPRAPSGCQNLKKWWPQMETGGLLPIAVKREPKEPKKKKNSSPIIKNMSGMLVGPPLPKPKQIIIKKTKQKASMPTFLPQSQITMQKSPITQTNVLPTLPLLSNSSQAAAAGLPTPTQSQVFISNSLMTPSTPSIFSETAPAVRSPSSSQPMVPSALDNLAEVGSPISSHTSTTTAVTFSSPSSSSKLSGLINIDPKYEELIRQFEAEFGESVPNSSADQSVEGIATKVGGKVSCQDLSTSSLTSSTSQSVPSNSSAAPQSDHQQMEISKDVSGPQSQVPLGHESIETPVEKWQKDQLFALQQQAAVQQQEPKTLDNTFSMPSSPLPKRMKIETSGNIAVLSTTCYSEEDTPTKEGLPCSPSLRGFLESPLRYLDSPTKSLLDTPSKDLQAEFPTCTCVEQILEKDEGPYYNHLGSGPTVASIRTLMETRYGEKGEAIRIEKAVYTGREGKSSRGCPIAKWVIRRGSEKEKLMCMVRHRAGHHCANAVIIILIMAWEGVPRAMADKLYQELSVTIPKYGCPTSRRCGLNDDRTCACQGKDPESCGASFSFGCSWSMYYNSCKYARSKMPRKFKLQGDHPEEEDKLRDNFQNLATEVAPLYKQLAPQAYSNQCQTEFKASECRLGLKEGRPFAGVTACMDFCAHAHKDQHNLYNGCTVVCTLTKEDNRSVGEIPEDEQLHVLPLYTLSMTDEFGNEEAQRLKMQTGAIQVLQAFRREVRKLPEPAKSCRQRRLEAKKAASEKKKNKLLQQAGGTPQKQEIKTEIDVTTSSQLQSNKGIKQEVKPIIKKEPSIGSNDGYDVQAADPFNNVYQHPAYYARGGLTANGQPSAPDAANGYLPSAPPYSPNARFHPKMRTYEGRNNSLQKPNTNAVQEESKPDIQSLQSKLDQSNPSHSEQTGQPNQAAYFQNADYNPSRPSSVSSEHSSRNTPVIKQEPMDVPVYDGALPCQHGANPQRAWSGHRPNGSLTPTSWESHLNRKQNAEAPPMNPDKQQFYQQRQQSSPYTQNWTSYPGSHTPMASPVPSPSVQLSPSPSPSPHLGTALQPNMYGSTQPPSPHPGTPQPCTTQSRTGTPQPGSLGPATPRHWASPAPSPQPNPWAVGSGAYSPGFKHSTPTGAFPDKLWCKTGESRCSTPLGLQEKVWKSFGGSVAGSTPSPAPEGRLFPDSLQQSEQACYEPHKLESDMEGMAQHELGEDEVWSDSEHNFLDPHIGGVAVAPAHGSILIECARRELHATTPLKNPDRSHPSRISLVFYQHKNLNQPMHGLAMWEAKRKLLAEQNLQRQQEALLLGLSQEEIKALAKKRKWGSTAAGASPGPLQSKDKKEGPFTRLSSTFHTSSVVTVSSYAFTRLTGPYRNFV
ncbi:methylcytosine dioxygenase TET3 isoform X2 [Gouania willdenowi]|nr:methylcytosine dioxygenase TET3 isoform X2 [Gouania willdenowi]XP_028312482.1 methylcytosine dioxygenase TET3 isoform X2 [Gouania willdenowi]